jgi:hypothetical protein
MFSVEYQMIQIYYFVNDYLKVRPRQAGWRRSPHSQPLLTDAEVITLALLQISSPRLFVQQRRNVT